MTIEAKLDQANKLLTDILAVLSKQATNPASPIASAVGASKAGPSHPPAKASAAAVGQATPAKPNEGVGAALSYEKDVKPLASQLLNKAPDGRAKLVELCAKYGTQTAMALKPEQFAAFIADVQLALKS